MVDYVTPSPAERQALQNDAVDLQSFMLRAAAPIAARWTYWQTLAHEARRYGLARLPVVSSELLDVHELLDEETKQWAEALQALDAGSATLVPYIIDGEDSVRWGVAKKGSVASGLGVWPVVFQVLRVAAGALAGAAAWMLTDAHLETERLRAESERAQAQTDDRLAQLAEDMRDDSPAAAAAIAESIGKARAAAERAKADTGGWLDTITGAAGTAFAGVGGLGLGALLALLWWSSTQEGGRA